MIEGILREPSRNQQGQVCTSSANEPRPKGPCGGIRVEPPRRGPMFRAARQITFLRR